VPPFPSLYNPTIVSTKQQWGFFLHDANGASRSFSADSSHLEVYVLLDAHPHERNV
jgi:hypothetical protein